MRLTITQVDAFTDRPFAGNPAAVCVLDRPRDDAWMQNVAAEMNLAETAFLVQRDDGFDLRWFTPAVEVNLCGHATLASAHVLWERELIRADDTAHFHTHSGLLSASRRGDSIELDFPTDPPERVDAIPRLAEALGVSPIYFGKGREDYIVEVESEQTVRALAPDFRALGAFSARGIIVTARSDDERFDFVSRFFAPASGIDEDPVTGSAHCTLCPHWAARLSREKLVGFQSSRRGGIVHVELKGERTLIRGQAVTVLRAELLC